jgi:hypothetical protein
MGLSITYHLFARGSSEEMRRRMSDWHTQLKTRLPDCRISLLTATDEQVSFDLLPGPGAEIARLRLRREQANLWNGGWDCKTQYAGCAQHGGPENFLKAHRCLITALDIGQSLGLVESVSDDSGYRMNRSIEKLLKQFHIYQNLVAALVSQLRDAGFSVESPLQTGCESVQLEHSAALECS